VTYSQYDSLLAQEVSAEERKAIIDALTMHLLIQRKGDLIEVTPKGREYIRLRGPLPSIPGLPGVTAGLPSATPG
jgi:hypothetical protein